MKNYTFLFALFFACNNKPAEKLTTEQVTKLTADAYVQCFPMVQNYQAIYFYGVLKTSPKYVPINSVMNDAKLYSPQDKFVQSPNNDTYYTSGILNVQDEPVIIKGMSKMYSNIEHPYFFSFTSLKNKI